MDGRGRARGFSPRFGGPARKGQFDNRERSGGPTANAGRHVRDMDRGTTRTDDMDEWRTVANKRQRQNTGGEFLDADTSISALDDFRTLSVDEKLNLMMTKLF
jgi:hypothetical protein